MLRELSHRYTGIVLDREENYRNVIVKKKKRRRVP
jgi:hypothetical protein